jgi:hypothetical protein
MQCDAGIAFATVPVAPVVFETEERFGDLFGGGFDFLQADDVGALTLDPLLDLSVTRPDAVNVPGGELDF